MITTINHRSREDGVIVIVVTIADRWCHGIRRRRRRRRHNIADDNNNNNSDMGVRPPPPLGGAYGSKGRRVIRQLSEEPLPAVMAIGETIDGRRRRRACVVAVVARAQEVPANEVYYGSSIYLVVSLSKGFTCVLKKSSRFRSSRPVQRRDGKNNFCFF